MRRIYDAVSPVYSISTVLLHSRAHRVAFEAAAIVNGTRVLEVATGSGEMFLRLVSGNHDGETWGVDLSPRMAARCQHRAERRFPAASAFCQSADVRYLPFSDEYFDTVVCCYLFELLPDESAADTLTELQRVLRPGGRLAIAMVGQNKPGFNAIYSACTRIAPAFWGRQVENWIPGLLEQTGFTVDADEHVGQLFYSSRVMSAAKAVAVGAGSTRSRKASAGGPR
jgi:ubiquinone/menaquinone biosynthesis C-methylase UbiE